MALQHEIWEKSIQDVLFQNQDFISKSQDHSAFVDKKIVHLPQSGAAPAVVVDRSSYPATITQRTDSEGTYTLKSFTTDPIHITDIDELQTSYQKRTSVLSSHLGVLNETIGDYTSNAWGIASGARVIETSGALVADALAPGATGTRKQLERLDIRNMAKVLDLDNVSSANRYLSLPTAMYYQLFSDDNNVSRDFMNKSSQEAGVIAELYGFKIMMRPTMNVYNTGGTKKAVGAATAITDHLGAIGWQSDYVSNALGSIKTYANENVAEYYGSIFSAKVEHAGAILRTDNKGVVALRQAV